ncbi:MAG: hypothetical protein QXE05_10945 [Nitrososphaeria archaeon]
MKYVSFPTVNFSASIGTWQTQLIYKNITNSYILIMGLLHQILLFSAASSSLSSFGVIYETHVSDPNDNIIDIVDQSDTSLQTFQGTTTVWNGTSMVSEPISVPVGARGTFSRVGNTMIPPQCSLIGAIYSTFAISASFGGWGLLINDEELMNIIIKRGKIVLYDND